MNIRNRIIDYRTIKASELAPHPNNWRKHPKSQQDAIRGILAEVGFVDALMVRLLPGGKYQIVDGHLRAETAPNMDVPVLVVDLDDAEAAKVLATFDPIGAMAEADKENLDAILKGVETQSDALREMLEGLAKDAGCEWAKGSGGEVVEDEVPEAPVDPVTKPGDLWLLGEHRLLCGDSTKGEDVGRLMGGEKAELLVTSPPYNQSIDKFKPSGMHKEGDWVAKVGRLAYSDSMPEEEYQELQRQCLVTWFEYLCDGASFFYNHKNRYRDKQIVSPLFWLPGPFVLRQEIVWARPGSVTQNARMFLPCDERIYWMYKGTGFYFDDSTEIKTWSTIWKIGLEANREHAVAFPVELPSRCIRACSRKEGLVFEPHCGSGTTLIAAQQLNRRCYGMEISPQYCDVIVKRWENLTGEKARLA
jgi:DNA modification methylase